MNKSSQEKIDDIFVQCSNKSESAAGSQSAKLDLILFSEFFNGVARVKFPTGSDYREKLLDNFTSVKSMKIQVDSSSSSFTKAMDRNVIKVLLKFDISLRRAFCSFAGKNISVGGNLTWDEVKKKSITMELDGFVAFCTFFSVVPGSLSVSEVETIVKTVLKSYPLGGSAVTLNSAILYPQFQLLMCLLGAEKHEAAAKKRGAAASSSQAKAPANSASKPFQFARKQGGEEARSLTNMLSDLLKKMGIDKAPAPGFSDFQSMTSAGISQVQEGVTAMGPEPGTLGAEEGSDGIKGSVTVPSYDNPEDQYASNMNHGRQAMLLRMEHLFDEVEGTLAVTAGEDKELRSLLSTSNQSEECLDAKNRLTSKPVVIGDAVPLPVACPEIVEQLLQAALAHHNLGSFRESLNFLEAARLQLVEIQRRIRKSRTQRLGAQADDGADTAASPDKDGHDDTSKDIPTDLSLYILICKGNVYQSCGDDEQSLLQYMEGWSLAKRSCEKDWEIICLNSIGILAYYSLRYEVAFMAFYAVAKYREETYGNDSADTATAWNNEGACLHALNKRRDARVRLEKSWNVVCKVLGHRAPRCIAIWKNLEKSRRANSTLTHEALKETIDIRPDASRLLVGGTFYVNATVEKTIGKKGGKKKGGKKK